MTSKAFVRTTRPSFYALVHKYNVLVKLLYWPAVPHTRNSIAQRYTFFWRKNSNSYRGMTLMCTQEFKVLWQSLHGENLRRWRTVHEAIGPLLRRTVRGWQIRQVEVITGRPAKRELRRLEWWLTCVYACKNGAFKGQPRGFLAAPALFERGM